MKRSASRSSRDFPSQSKRRTSTGRYDDGSHERDERMTPERVMRRMARSPSPRPRYISPHRDEYTRTREIPPERYSFKVLCVSNLHPKASEEFIKETLYREYKKFRDVTIRISPNLEDRVAYVCFRTFEDAQEAKHANPRITFYGKLAIVEPIYEFPRGESRSITPEPPVYGRHSHSHSPEPERRRSIDPYDRYGSTSGVTQDPREFTPMDHHEYMLRQLSENHTAHSGPSHQSTITAPMGSGRTLPNEAPVMNRMNMTRTEREIVSLQGDEQEQSPRVRKFTTSQRKYLRRLLDSGMNYEAASARVLATRPKQMPLLKTEPRKRNNAMPSENRKVSVRDSEPLSTCRVSLIHRDHPFYLLSKDQMNALELAVSEEIDKIPVNGPKIQFRNWDVRHGMVVVDCTEEASVQWLMGIVARKKLVQGVSIIAVYGDNVPKTATCSIWIPAADKTSPSSILARIRKQNDVESDRWNILQVDADEKGRTIVLSIDEPSLNKLKKMNMKVFYLVRQLEIIRVGTGSRQPRRS
ncbi:uncharacterized protein LOC129804762 [Phlebotomus papatasi]|uniref:uncharacterized protein LOC129804762 n=1 Tax=Phlebotomus papatasi TaxID=29031 RepID=UPI00248416CC|nr:uncharacterized protein LOC129804762 [Phlebotomus papatasi]